MPTKPEPALTAVKTYLTNAEYRRLKRLAKAADCSVSAAARELLTMALDKAA